MLFLITSREKAFVGGLGAGMTTFAGQLSVGGKLDAKTVAWSLGAWLATHLFVYYTTNTPVVETPAAPADVPTPPSV